LHAHHDLTVDELELEVVRIGGAEGGTKVPIRRVDRVPKKPLLVIYFHDALTAGAAYEVRLRFVGNIWENVEGIFEGKYKQQQSTGPSEPAGTESEGVTEPEEHSFIGTYFRPHHARRVFPCFDEPSYKVPFNVSIVRPRTHHVLFNTALERTVETGDGKHVIDVFKQTAPMSTFTFGFLVSDLQQVTPSLSDEKEDERLKPTIRVWARRDFQKNVADVQQRVKLALRKLQEYWGVPLPLEKLDVVALPGFSYVKPADNWGLIVFKESELMRGYYNLAQELVYQWLGSWITPHWWSDAHVNKAIAGFLSADTAIKIDGGDEFEGKYPMTILYSIYYEFSKRYPHSRITAMKQETTCSKTELVLRMLNYTLGEATFRRGLQRFIQHREYKTFYGEDVWEALTKQAHLDQRLCESVTVNDVVNSWITKDRIPMVRVVRSYANRTATVTQRLYLRERPHDVPEQDKMLWWIPLVVVRQDRLNFGNVSTIRWMKQVREVTLDELPGPDEFIIVNPEEIGPFPVNYDERNWNLLATFLQKEESRTMIPVYTRVANQFICPVFKWGTREEWEFGLQRVINFPESRVKSERTYLLKTLAGCPSQPFKIDRLLNIMVLEDNGNFTDNDISLIFKMLSGGSSGYSTLFNFLKNNWDAIKLRFKDRESLWDNMINSATGLFTTQEGYDMVSQLYVQHQGEFGTAEHIIEKSLKNIKEETKWSDENLPVIEQWLDHFLASNGVADQKFLG
uniref:Aminopeptidase n=1 Tax=Anopheles coluzzii TaxID=1518534 RepID=A0A8W7PVR4_ANOCL